MAHRYLIEKFVQLQPKGSKKLTIDELKVLLGFVDRFLNMCFISDWLQYGIYPAGISIDEDYVVSTVHKINIEAMNKKFSNLQAQINLGIIGDKNDKPESRIPMNECMQEMDNAFLSDFGFSFMNLINVTQVMSLWAANNINVPEMPFYSATSDEIMHICETKIKEYVSNETTQILNFLTLKAEDLLKIQGDVNLAEDLPVWEHNKRLMRYIIRPLIRFEDKYYWEPYSIEKAGMLWSGIPTVNRLPANIEAPSIKKVLKKGHEISEASLVDKIFEIAKRYTDHVKENIYLHKYDSEITDIGDCDVIVLLEKKNILLSIEGKHVDLPYCVKDTKRVREKIFGREKKDGSIEKGYLDRVEARSSYLKGNASKIIKGMGWPVPPESPKIISLFVTQIDFWWTVFPPKNTEVSFVSVVRLDDFIKKVIADVDSGSFAVQPAPSGAPMS